jgi:hypothetical protein
MMQPGRRYQNPLHEVQQQPQQSCGAKKSQPKHRTLTE